MYGLQAYYFGTSDFLNSTSAYGGRANATETEVSGSDNGFGYSWGSLGPGLLGEPGTDYSVRFVGDITLGATGDPARLFTFETWTDAGSGIQLIVDGQLLINQTSSPGGTLESPAVLLPGGKNQIVVQYSEANSEPDSLLALSYECSDTPTNCSGFPTSMTQVPSTILTPAWNNPTSTVSPTGKVSYSHFNQPWTGLAQYTQVEAPVNGASSPSPLVTSFSYDSFGRTTGKVLPNGNPSPSFSTATDNPTYGTQTNDNGNLLNPGDAATSQYGTSYYSGQ